MTAAFRNRSFGANGGVARSLGKPGAAYPGRVATDADLTIAVDRQQTRLAVALTPTATTMIVTSGAGIVAHSLLSIDDELVQTQAGADTIWQILRARDGTAAAAHAVSAVVSGFVDAWHHNALVAEVEAIETFLGPNGQNLNATGPFVATAPFHFTPVFPTTPASLIVGANQITFPVVPAGVNGSDAGHYLYVDTTGTPEACLIIGGSGFAGQSNGQIIIQCANPHPAGYRISSATSGIQEAIAGTSGVPSWIIMPPGNLTIRGPITLPGHYRLCGASVRATTLAVAANFPLSAAGVIVLPADNVGFQQIEDFTMTFIQPDSPDISVYTHWPPGINGSLTSYWEVRNLHISLPWRAIDAGTSLLNGSGFTIENVYIGGFDFAIRFTGEGDTVRLSNIHNATGATATSNNVTAFVENATGIINNGSFLHLDSYLSLALTKIVINGGYSNIDRCAWDGVHANGYGIKHLAGHSVASNCYFTLDTHAHLVDLTGGELILTDSAISATASGVGAIPLMKVSNALGGGKFLRVANCHFSTPGADVVHLQASATLGDAVLDVIGCTFNNGVGGRINPFIEFLTNTSYGSVIGNDIIAGAGVAIRIAAAPSLGSTVIKGNNLRAGNTISLPTSPANIQIDQGVPTWGLGLAAAGTIAPAGQIVQVAGAGPIATITIPGGMNIGQITIIPVSAFTTVTTGNIAIASTAVVGRALIMTYDPAVAKWYPSY